MKTKSNRHDTDTVEYKGFTASDIQNKATPFNDVSFTVTRPDNTTFKAIISEDDSVHDFLVSLSKRWEAKKLDEYAEKIEQPRDFGDRTVKDVIGDFEHWMDNILVDSQFANEESEDEYNYYQNRIVEACDDIKTLLLTKNAAYGDSAFNDVSIFGNNIKARDAVCCRIADKLKRMETVGVNDGIEDTLDDLIGYALILKILIEDGEG